MILFRAWVGEIAGAASNCDTDKSDQGALHRADALSPNQRSSARSCLAARVVSNDLSDLGGNPSNHVSSIQDDAGFLMVETVIDGLHQPVFSSASGESLCKICTSMAWRVVGFDKRYAVSEERFDMEAAETLVGKPKSLPLVDGFLGPLGAV